MDQNKFIEVALRWWNVQRGYRADGSDDLYSFSAEEVENYEGELRLKICNFLREEWLRRGNPLHPE